MEARITQEKLTELVGKLTTYLTMARTIADTYKQAVKSGRDMAHILNQVTDPIQQDLFKKEEEARMLDDCLKKVKNLRPFDPSNSSNAAYVDSYMTALSIVESGVHLDIGAIKSALQEQLNQALQAAQNLLQTSPPPRPPSFEKIPGFKDSFEVVQPGRPR